MRSLYKNAFFESYSISVMNLRANAGTHERMYRCVCGHARLMYLSRL